MEGKDLVFVLEVVSTSSLWSPAEGAALPTAWLAVRFPGEVVAFRGTPVPSDKSTGNGTYPFRTKLAYRRKYSRDLIKELLSNQVSITFYKDAPPPDPPPSKNEPKGKKGPSAPREKEPILPETHVARLAIDLLPLLQGATAIDDVARAMTAMNDARDDPKVTVSLNATAHIRLTVHLDSSAEAALAAAVAAPPGSLPLPTPASVAASLPADVLASPSLALLSAEEFQKCTLFEVAVTSPLTPSGTPMPPELGAASDKAGPGNLLFRLALSLPIAHGVSDTLLIPYGALASDRSSLRFTPGVARTLLRPDHIAYLQSNLESTSLLAVECGRYLKKTAEHVDPAAFRYHIVGSLPVGALMQPGATEAALDVAFTQTLKGAIEADLLRGETHMPEIAPGTTEGPPLEDVPNNLPPQPPLAPHATPEQVAEAKVAYMTTQDTIAPNKLIASALQGQLTLRVSKPLVAPWVAPEPPSMTLSQLIPPKLGGGASDAAPLSALGRFREQCTSLARELAADYLSQTRDASSGTVDPAGHTQRQREMRFKLNKSGKFQEIRESLRSAVVEVVKARGDLPSNPTASEMAPLYSDVYQSLVKELHAALDSLFRPRAAAPEEGTGPGPVRIQSLIDLALECEVTNRLPRAQQALLDALVGCRDASLWVTYARFHLRHKAWGRAEEALREAIALDDEFVPALALLTLLLVQQGYKEDGLRFKEAEVVAQAMRLSFPTMPLAWSLLAAVYSGMGVNKSIEAANAASEARRLAKESSEEATVGFVQAMDMALEVHCDAAARGLLLFIPALHTLPMVTQCRVEMMRAQLAALNDETEGALTAAKRAAALVGSGEEEDARLVTRLHVMRGNILYNAGRLEEASLQYHLALKRAEPDDDAAAEEEDEEVEEKEEGVTPTLTQLSTTAELPLEVYLRLGASLLVQKDAAGALQVYLRACRRSGACASAWIGAGRALLSLQDYHRADLALTEATSLDAAHGDAWGLLALTALRQGRMSDAEQALRHALRNQFSDVAALRELGKAFFIKSDYATAVSTLRRAVAASVEAKGTWEQAPEAATRVLLGEALLEMREAASAREELLRGARIMASAAAAAAAGKEGSEDALLVTSVERERVTALLQRAAALLDELPSLREEEV